MINMFKILKLAGALVMPVSYANDIFPYNLKYDLGMNQEFSLVCGNLTLSQTAFYYVKCSMTNVNSSSVTYNSDWLYNYNEAYEIHPQTINYSAINIELAFIDGFSYSNTTSTQSNVVSLSFEGYDNDNFYYDFADNWRDYLFSSTSKDIYFNSSSDGTNHLSLYIKNIPIANTYLLGENQLSTRIYTNFPKLNVFFENIRIFNYNLAYNPTGVNIINVVDLNGLIFTILALPFSFLSKAFDFTFFAGTEYAFNISSIFLFIVAVLCFIAVLKLILPFIRK